MLSSGGLRRIFERSVKRRGEESFEGVRDCEGEERGKKRLEMD